MRGSAIPAVRYTSRTAASAAARSARLVDSPAAISRSRMSAMTWWCSAVSVRGRSRGHLAEVGHGGLVVAGPGGHHLVVADGGHVAARGGPAGGCTRTPPPRSTSDPTRAIPGCARARRRAGPWPSSCLPLPPGGGVVGLGLRLLGGALRLDVVLLGSGRGDLRLDVGGVRVGRLGGRGRAGPPPAPRPPPHPTGRRPTVSRRAPRRLPRG